MLSSSFCVCVCVCACVCACVCVRVRVQFCCAVVANKLRKLNSTERENVGGDGGGGGILLYILFYNYFQLCVLVCMFVVCVEWSDP